ncbi:hypothetical protein WCWAEYFT_CDS0215 [Vibrio phage VB_VaC_TDDLMA]
MIYPKYKDILKDEGAVEIDGSSEQVKEFLRDLDPNCNPRDIRMFFKPDEHRFLVYSIPKRTERIHGIAIILVTFPIWFWFEDWRTDIMEDYRGLIDTRKWTSEPVSVFTLEYLLQDKNFGGLGKRVLLDMNMEEYLI